MDFFSGLKTEVFRPVATIFVPGTVAVVPYVLIAKSYNPAWGAFAEKNGEVFTALALVAIISAGMIIEGLGSRIEVLWDKLLEAKHSHAEEWKKYLSLTLKDEIIGQRYLQTVVIRMKFELSFCVALVFFAIGLNWLNAIECYWTLTSMVHLTIAILILALYILWESWGSAKVACMARQEILNGYDGSR